MEKDNCNPVEGGNAPKLTDAGTGYAGSTGSAYGVGSGDLDKGFTGGGSLGTPKKSDKTGGDC